MNAVVVYIALRPHYAAHSRLASNPPSVYSFSRVADTPLVRKWLFSRDDVVTVWGPYSALAAPVSESECTDDKIIFSAKKIALDKTASHP